MLFKQFCLHSLFFSSLWELALNKINCTCIPPFCFELLIAAAEHTFVSPLCKPRITAVSPAMNTNNLQFLFIYLENTQHFASAIINHPNPFLLCCFENYCLTFPAYLRHEAVALLSCSTLTLSQCLDYDPISFSPTLILPVLEESINYSHFYPFYQSLVI